jgi:hypothetical protein
MSESAIERALHLTPFWLLAFAVFFGMAVAAYVGWWLRQRRNKSSRPVIDKEDDQENLVVSSVMGLLALLIGFTFSLAIDRFDTRRERVLMEANAIGTAYLRTQLLEEPHRARISKILVTYTDLSLELSQARPGPAQQALQKKNDALVTDLWAATMATFPTIRSYDFSSAYLDSINGLIDLNAARQQARRSRVPSEIFLSLYLYQLIAAGVIGYVLIGRGGRRTGVLLLLLFGISLVIVIDVDYPGGGGINTAQTPMLELKSSLAGWSSENFNRYSPAPP